MGGLILEFEKFIFLFSTNEKAIDESISPYCKKILNYKVFIQVISNSEND